MHGNNVRLRSKFRLFNYYINHSYSSSSKIDDAKEYERELRLRRRRLRKEEKESRNSAHKEESGSNDE
jgi:hypothetical protein